MQPEDILKLTASNAQGKPVPLSASPARAGSRVRCRPYATTATRPCALTAARPRATAPGDAMAEMENLAASSCPKVLRLSGPVSPAKKNWPARRPSSCTALPFWPCSCAWLRCTRAGPSPGGDSGGAPGRAGRAAGHPDARLCQRRVLPGRPDHHHRPVGQERDSDHRICERPAAHRARAWSRRRWPRHTCAFAPS
jgi:hypothetical protein